MSPDHLCEEGLAHREDIEIPFHVIFLFSNDFAFSLQNTPQCTFLIFWTHNQDSFTDIQIFIGHIPCTALLVFHFVIQSLHRS